MGTAVLNPQDCLASRQSSRNYHFLSTSEHPSSATRSRASPAPSFAADCARRGSSGNTNLMEGRGLLGRKNVSAGLLPLPDQATWSSHPSFGRSGPKVPSCRFGETVDPYVSRHSMSFLRSSLGSAASGHPLTRYPSVPCFDYEVPMRRWFSECSPVLGVQSYERRSPRGGNQSVVMARLSSNSAQGKCMVGSWSRVAGVASSYQKRVLPADTQSTCKLISTVGRKHRVSRQLKRSAFEKVQDRMKMSILPKPSSKEAARKLITSLFEEVTGSHSSNCCSMKRDGCVDMETKGVIEDHSASISGSIAQGQHDVPKVHVTSTFEVLDSKVTLSNAKKSDSVLEMGGISRSPDSVLDGSNRWLSMTEEKWAGPSFFNSPAPSALPVPSFTSKLSRVTSTCSMPIHFPDCGGQTVPASLFPEAKRTWDATIATMDLRRMLNLDCSPCDL